jgi:hypothetical protein
MNTTDLKGKKVLFIAPKFFGYEIQIVQAMQKLGATVYFHSDKPSENVWVKILLRLFPKLVWPWANRIYITWLDKQRLTECDLVFIVKGEAISPKFLRILKLRYPTSKFIFYMWDSIANVKYTVEKLVFFDSISSFDSLDCRAYPQIRYRPLFFINHYQQRVENEERCGLFFFGTLNGDRPKVLARIVRVLGAGVPFDYGLFVRSKWELLLRKWVDDSFDVLEKERLIFQPIPATVIKQRMSVCNCVLDIEHPKQTGLTMRTFEVLASGKKLITTNSAIRNEPFFDPSLICVIDRKEPIIPPDFISGLTPPIHESFFVKNSLNGWLYEILKKD